MKESARYAKIVEWSEEDQCCVGSSPGLIYGGCHGPDAKAVFDRFLWSNDFALVFITEPLAKPFQKANHEGVMMNWAGYWQKHTSKFPS
jgi:hypothetical protein